MRYLRQMIRSGRVTGIVAALILAIGLWEGTAGAQSLGGYGSSAAGIWGGTNFAFPGGPVPYPEAVDRARRVFGNRVTERALNADPSYWYNMANPRAHYPAWTRQWTSMGPCIPGFTVGCK